MLEENSTVKTWKKKKPVEGASFEGKGNGGAFEDGLCPLGCGGGGKERTSRWGTPIRSTNRRRSRGPFLGGRKDEAFW